VSKQYEKDFDGDLLAHIQRKLKEREEMVESAKMGATAGVGSGMAVTLGGNPVASTTNLDANTILLLLDQMKKRTESDGDPFRLVEYNIDTLALKEPPKWPADRHPPSDWTLLAMSGYKSDEHRGDNIGYYNTLLERAWRQTGDAGKRDLLAQHKSAVSKAAKIGDQPDELLKMDKELKLPASCVPPKTYTADDHPFETMDEVETYMLLLAAWDFHIRKMDLHIQQPVTMQYCGHTIKFMGMETYRLEWIEWTAVTHPETGKITKRNPSFYLAPRDAGNVKLYGISATQFAKLFGGTVTNLVADTIKDISKRTEVVELRKAVEQLEAQKRYAGTGMEFGGWA
jgi:hypothetical protein